ncbi:Cro/CI family transcriptional regulator [Oceanisphaera sp. KMM 10153]|uniref:Cro/CI family transcriptional regulator n=1 Tax=Oceanisphaera submarina TaxID=3390193 RepID=UPI003974B2FE
MKKKAAIEHFGGVVKLAEALGIKPQSVSQWPDEIPQGRAFQIELITKGSMKALQPAKQQS